MREIAINICYGGFGLSRKAMEFLCELGDKKAKEVLNPSSQLGGHESFFSDIHYERRDCPLLIQAIKILGEEAYGNYSKLKIVEIPDDVEWQIEEYDGMEHIAEKHRMWS